MSHADPSVSELQQQVIDIARRAGEEIMRIYARDDTTPVSLKADHTPLTEADRSAHRLIHQALSALTPEVPVLSEESSAVELESRRQWSRFWMVDPLDGTKEFIRRNGEFTVNIALIDAHRPVLAVIEAPALDVGYTARSGAPALRYPSGPGCSGAAQWEVLQARRWYERTPLRLLESRSHSRDPQGRWRRLLPEHSTRRLGSSLKSCQIAAGEADLYLRLGPTGEWDTAAAQLILECAGGALVELGEHSLGEALGYNRRDSLINPHFAAFAPGVAPLLEALLNRAD
ncbi:3'(2'),5'-bisphosphate nucleotidase CysQ [Halotalea alkalilenta]|uniref:3'(2'),5'-bisphosphate nucleotidase CysQ n=1 Tax=Halotalea alkalilenta TaxID=376489 RepID=A0A172YEH6_9GAMM|nr:3'(2'),5'-bisphosphate nucleotidase CysQ [Halotalea alkalilenta]ANF57658.1 hypothetical protein A5892_09445 [Halotalea alkalilenta]